MVCFFGPPVYCGGEQCHQHLLYGGHRIEYMSSDCMRILSDLLFRVTELMHFGNQYQYGENCSVRCSLRLKFTLWFEAETIRPNDGLMIQSQMLES